MRTLNAALLASCLLSVLGTATFAAELTAPLVRPAQGWANKTPFEFAVRYTDALGAPPASLRLFLIHPNKQVQDIPLDVSRITADQARMGAIVRYRVPKLLRAGKYAFYFTADVAAGQLELGKRSPFHFTVRNIPWEIAQRAGMMLVVMGVLYLLYVYLLAPHAPVGRIPATAIWTILANLSAAVLIAAYLVTAPAWWVPVSVVGGMLLLLAIIMSP